MGTKLKAAVIGCGRIGSTFEDQLNTLKPHSHAGAFMSHPGTVLVGGCDSGKSILSSFKKRWGTNTYTSIRQLLEEEKPDIVSVCTPPHTHAEIISQVVKDKNVRLIWCEKPVAHTLADARKINQLTADAGKLLAVNYWRRWDQFHKKIADVVQNELGELHTVFAQAHVGIVNTGTHMFDLLNQYTNKRVEAVEAHLKEDGSCDPGGQLILYLENNITVLLDNNWKKAQVFGVTALGEIKSIKAYADSVLLEKAETFIGNKPAKYLEGQDFRIRSPMYLAVDNFINALTLNDKRILCDHSNGLDTLLVAVAAHISSKENRKVFLQELMGKKYDNIVLNSRKTSLTRDGK